MDKLVFKSLCALCISSSQLAMTMQTSNVASIITFQKSLLLLKILLCELRVFQNMLFFNLFVASIIQKYK
jgi:hypothetical protein